jgi:hypothetical protein
VTLILVAKMSDISAAIFRSQNHENLSNLYQELECQHHLIQEEPFTKPMIPALTPEGFAHWMTTWILAYPDQEAKRLEKVVVSTPIDADGETVDGKPERLPKVCSRHSRFRRITNKVHSKSHAISFQVENIPSPKRQFAMPSPSSWRNSECPELGGPQSLALQ